MSGFRNRLPPANSLIVFEAVARNASFTRAARELGVTQAAVSRQVRILESDLGTDLFARLHRRIELTPDGERYRDAVSIGLGQIARATDAIRRTADGADVTVSCSVTFAAYWLMSRIAKFRAQFPEIDIGLVASARVRDLAAAGIDVAVRYGKGQWPGVSAEHLFGDEVLPVCAPSYASRHGPFDSPRRLAAATLLHLSQFDRNWVTWERWFEACDAAVPPHAHHLYFDNYMLLMHAAVRGEGVALCGGRLAEDLIQRGELIRASEQTLASEYAFYLLYPDGRDLRRGARRFRDWLLDEARGAA